MDSTSQICTVFSIVKQVSHVIRFQPSLTWITNTKSKRCKISGDQFKAEPKEMTVGEYLAYMYQKTYASKKEAV